MTLNAFESKLNKLRTNNPELVEQYESMKGDILDVDICDMHQFYEKVCKQVRGVDPAGFTQRALFTAVLNRCDILDAMQDILEDYSNGVEADTCLQKYFNEINNVYNRNDNDYNIVYCQGNRDKLIEMNLKTVISVAKGYQGLGLTLEELISAGNLGLVLSFDKYDQTRAKLKDDMLSCISDLPDDATPEKILKHIEQYLTYGDIVKKFSKAFGVMQKNTVVSWKDFTKNDVIKWIRKNIHNASFNSVAFMWIRAYILIEIDNYSRIVKKPKSEIYNDKLTYGAYKKEVTVDIDASVNEDGDTCIGDLLDINEAEDSDLDISEAYDAYKEGLNKLLDGVKPRDRTVFLKKFGIGLPRPMLPKEIAIQENLSIARISQIFQTVVEQVRENQIKYNINIDELLTVASKFR